MAEDWSEALAALYERLDDALAEKGWLCNGCGECCHFDQVDHILYVSDMEREYLLRMSEAAANPDGSAELLEQGLRCPYQEEGRCTARKGRPLGCRLHFCSVADDSDFYEYWHTRLKEVHVRSGYGWNYRPLLPL